MAQPHEATDVTGKPDGSVVDEVSQKHAEDVEDVRGKKEHLSGFDAIRAHFSTVPVPSQPLKEGWEIPVIDLNLLRSPYSRGLAVERIGKACEEWGFFHVVNHSVPAKVISDMWKAFDVLYQVPIDERGKFDNGPFLPPDILRTLAEKMKSMPKFGDSRDTIRFSKLNPDDKQTAPNAPEGFRGPAIVFFKALRDVGFELLDAISEGLELETNYIRRVTGNNPCVNSSIHRYLPYHDAESTMGLNPHRDIDTLTVLLQNDVTGLQVMKEDRWVDVRPLEGSLVVNVGEVIQAITNQKYHSALHRAMLDKENVRASISCFLLPTSDSIIEPLPHLVSEQNPPFQPTCNWDTYFYNHFARVLKL